MLSIFIFVPPLRCGTVVVRAILGQSVFVLPLSTRPSYFFNLIFTKYFTRKTFFFEKNSQVTVEMIPLILPSLPKSLKNIQHFLDMAVKYETSDPTICYWS